MRHHGPLTSIVFAIALCLLAWSPVTQAHSRKQPPFRRAHTPFNPSIRLLRRSPNAFEWRKSLLPRPTSDDIRHDDTFLLNFSLSPEDEPISIVFKPAADLLHRDATLISQNSPSERLFSHQFRVFEGEVVHEADVEDVWAQTAASVLRPQSRHPSRGWARLLLRDDGAWDGSAHIDGETWHFKPTHVYERERTLLSPEIPMTALVRRGKLGGNTVILLSRDSMTHEEEAFELRKRGLRSASYDAGEPSCSHDTLEFNLDQLEQYSYASSLERAALERRSGPLLGKRQDIQGGNASSSFASSIGSTQGCPNEQKVLFVGVAADCTATQVFGSTNEAKQTILSLINSVSGIYSRTFNISVGVVEMQVMDPVCPSSQTESEPWNVPCATTANGIDLNTRLSLFSQWRANKGGGDGVGLWHLITNCNSGSEVGVAWLSQVCQVEASQSRGQTSSGTAVTALTDRSWEVIAHEQGHSFGAIHDCDSACSSETYTSRGVSCCPLSLGNCDANSQYIMSPVSSRNVSSFSPCSVGNICTMYASGLNTTCIVDPGQRATLSTNACGNGIVEPGEECDPGAGSESNCCNPETCQLLPDALCDPASSSCCTSTCQYQPSDFVCRPAKNDECDQAETCTGTGPSCPADSFTADGTKCGDDGDGLSCASGLCTSRDQQCRAQGATLGITRACSQAVDTCAITCADPRSGGNDCVILDGTFTDGLECGLAGRCKNGECSNGSVADTAKAWIQRYPQIAYPVIVIGSLLVLGILYAIIRCCCCGSRKSKKSRLPPSAQYAAGLGGGRRNNNDRNSRRMSRSIRQSNTPAPQQNPRHSLYAPQPLIQPTDSNSTRMSNTPHGSFNSLGGSNLTEAQHSPVYNPPSGPPPGSHQSHDLAPGAPSHPPQAYRPPSMPPPGY